jgi:diguanylate cyclase (GGDEF)-like protein
LVNKIDGEFTEDDLRLLESVAALMATAIEKSRLDEWTSSFILVDPLTRLPNHRFLVQALEREAARCRRYRRACSVLFLGVDRRLQLPEPRWHDLSIVVEQTLRQSDLLCRHRDGPFVIILPETKSAGVRALADRIRDEVKQAGLTEAGGADLVEHVRFGVASFPGDVVDPKDLLEHGAASLAQAWQE